jgi:hypothetical protein
MEGNEGRWLGIATVNGDPHAPVAVPPVPNGWAPEPFWTFQKKR